MRLFSRRSTRVARAMEAHRLVMFRTPPAGGKPACSCGFNDDEGGLVAVDVLSVVRRHRHKMIAKA